MMALAFMVLGVPVVTGILRLTDTLASDAQVKTNLVRRDYCGLAAVEYVRFIALDETRWDDWWAAPGRVITAPGVVPVIGEELLTIGSCEQISFKLQLADVPGQPPVIAPSQLQTTKTVNTSTVALMGQVTYTIVVTNPAGSPSPENLTTIFDGLPVDFSYVPGTTVLNGQPFGEPITSTPSTEEDEFCMFVAGDLTINANDNIPCSIGATGNITIGAGAIIGGSVKSVTGNVDIEKNGTITGNITATVGNVNIKKGGTVGGTIRAGGNVDIKKDASVVGTDVSVGGHIVANGNVTLAKDGVFSGDVVALTGNIIGKKDSNLQGDLWAGGNVTLAQDIAADQNVWAQGNVDLAAGATVGTPPNTGVVITGGIFTGNPSDVYGGVTSSCQESNVPPCYIPPVPAWVTMIEGQRSMLTWDVSNAGVSIPPGGSATLSFTAQVSNDAGYYCNQAWVDPGSTGGSTGLTAPVAVGSPSGTLCAGEELVLTTTVTPNTTASDTQPTFTYTTTVQNNGPTELHFSMVKQKLPPGFSYTVNSATQLVGGSPQFMVDPSIVTTGGRQTLTWYPQPFADEDLYPGVPKTLIFQATPNTPLARGDYRAESWAFFREIDSAETPYTFPTALIRVRDPFEGTATFTSGTELASYEAWLGTNSSVFNWTIR